MMLIGRRVLLRSLPVLFALLLAFFTPPADVADPPCGTAVSLSVATGPATASVAETERGDRTNAASPAGTTAGPVAGTPTAAPAVADRAFALATQRFAGVAASRAPPATA